MNTNNDDDEKLKEKKKKIFFYNPKEDNKNVIHFQKPVKVIKVKPYNSHVLIKSSNNLYIKDNEISNRNIFENKKKTFRESYKTFNSSNNIDFNKNKKIQIKINYSNIDKNSLIKLPKIQNLLK